MNADGKWRGDLKTAIASVSARIENLKTGQAHLPLVVIDTTLKADKIRADLSISDQSGTKLHLSGAIDHWRRSAKIITVDTLRLSPPKACPGDQAPPALTNQGPIRIEMAQNGLSVSALQVVSRTGDPLPDRRPCPQRCLNRAPVVARPGSDPGRLFLASAENTQRPAVRRYRPVRTLDPAGVSSSNQA